MKDHMKKKRFNERMVGPEFDDIFRLIRFKLVFQNKTAPTRHSTEPQFLNDFICKQMDYFSTVSLPQGYTEHIFLKLLDPKRIIELNIVKLDSNHQILFLFKEVSIYNKLSRAKTTEKFSNILINSIAHNLYTPLNALIQLNKSMSDIITGVNELAEQNVHMIGICLQQLVFTTHNILEMSKIKQGKFKPNVKEVKLGERLDNIYEFFRDDMRYREIQFKVRISKELRRHFIFIDEGRLSIILYNLFSNSVKHTTGGYIKISAKLISLEEGRKQLKRAPKGKEVKQKPTEQLDDSKSDEDSSEESQISYQDQSITNNNETVDVENTLMKESLDDGEGKHYLQICISDTGTGMNEDAKRKCFTLFGNLKFKKDINQGGMGLGLASASLLCKAL